MRAMNILIVESKAKCKTLLKYLGKDEWRVMPTGGHVERLAEDRKLHPPKEVRKAYWSHKPNELPSPPWFWTERGEAAMRAILDEAAKHDSVTFYLAADPDRAELIQQLRGRIDEWFAQYVEGRRDGLLQNGMVHGQERFVDR